MTEAVYERIVSYDVDEREKDTPASFYVVNVGGHAKLHVPDDSPIIDFPPALMFYTMGKFFGELADVMNQNAAMLNSEEDEW